MLLPLSKQHGKRAADFPPLLGLKEKKREKEKNKCLILSAPNHILGGLPGFFLGSGPFGYRGAEAESISSIPIMASSFFADVVDFFLENRDWKDSASLICQNE